METSRWTHCCCCCCCGKEKAQRRPVALRTSPPQYLPPPTYWQVLQDVRTGEILCRSTKPVYIYSSAPQWRPPYISFVDHELTRIFEKQKVRPVLRNAPHYYSLRGRRLPWNRVPPPPPLQEPFCRYKVWIAWAAVTVIGNAVTGSIDNCWKTLAFILALFALVYVNSLWNSYYCCLGEHCSPSRTLISLKQLLKNAVIALMVLFTLGVGFWTYFLVRAHCSHWVADAALVLLIIMA